MSASGVLRSHTPEHHECVDLLLPERTRNNVAMSSTELEMTNQVRTTDKPVVLMQAPVELLAQQPVSYDDMSKRMKDLSTS